MTPHPVCACAGAHTHIHTLTHTKPQQGAMCSVILKERTWPTAPYLKGQELQQPYTTAHPQKYPSDLVTARY